MRVFDGPPPRKHIHQPVTRSKGELISFIILITYCNERQCSRLARKRPPSRKTQATSITWQCRYNLLSLLFITGLYTSAKDLAVLPELSDRRLFNFTFPYAFTHYKHLSFKTSECRGVVLCIRNGGLSGSNHGWLLRSMYYALYTIFLMSISLLVNHCYASTIRRTTITLILRRSRTGTVWFYTSTSNKRAARPKLFTKSLTRDLKLMYSRLTLVRISINL